MKGDLPTAAEVKTTGQGSGRREYPAYKPTEVRWLRDIPSHWKLKRLKHVIRCLDGKRVPLNTEQRGEMQGEYPYWGANGIVDHVNDWLFDEPLVMLGEDGAPFFAPNKTVARFVDGKIWVNNHAHILRPWNVHPKFLAHALNIVEYRAFIDGSTRDKLTQGDMNDIPLQCPPMTEQKSIVSYLDRETAKIEALVAKKERLIELLQEKRTALISHAVTKGLNPDVKSKESGIRWMGSIPVHWTLPCIKYVSNVFTGGTPNRDVPEYWNGDIPWVKTGEVNYSLVTNSEEHISAEGLRHSAAKLAPVGTLLLALYGEGVTRGRVAILGVDATFNQACAAFSFQEGVLNTYVRYWFIFAYKHIRELGNENTQLNLSGGAVKNLKLPLPPLKEQQAIVTQLDSQTSLIDALVERVVCGITRLKEYRTALISAAVTGKIDVRAVP